MASGPPAIPKPGRAAVCGGALTAHQPMSAVQGTSQNVTEGISFLKCVFKQPTCPESILTTKPLVKGPWGGG